MTEQIDDAERKLVSIHSREAAEASALIQEMTAMVARLSREARQMRQEVAGLRNPGLAAVPSSVPRLPGVVPDAPR